MKLKYIRIVSELIVDEGEISEGNMTERNMSYKQKKLERKPQTPEELEAIVEEEVRELVQRYNILIGYYDGYDCYDETHDTYSHDTAKEELLEILNKENI